MTDLPVTKADDDLVALLRNDLAPMDWLREYCRDAADEIERLRSKIAAAETTNGYHVLKEMSAKLYAAEAQLQAMRKALETFLMCWDFGHGSWSLAALEAARGRAKAALTEGAGKC